MNDVVLLRSFLSVTERALHGNLILELVDPVYTLEL